MPEPSLTLPLAFIGATINVLVVIVGIGLLIFVHELGHFLTARMFGLVIKVFSVGFGPSIWQKRHKGVLYKIGWIPFGGYVALPQLDPSGMEHIQGGEGEAAPAEVVLGPCPVLEDRCSVDFGDLVQVRVQGLEMTKSFAVALGGHCCTGRSRGELDDRGPVASLASVMGQHRRVGAADYLAEDLPVEMASKVAGQDRFDGPTHQLVTEIDGVMARP